MPYPPHRFLNRSYSSEPSSSSYSLLLPLQPAHLARLLLAFSLLSSPPTFPMAPPPPPPSHSHLTSRPNIVLVIADDLGYGDLGCYGQRLIHTPHLDRLASQGLRFTAFYAGAPICAPSRAVLFTGLHVGRTTIDRNASPDIPIAPHETTFAQLLATAGYTTAFIGKWGLGGATFSTNYGGTYPHLNVPDGGADSILADAAHALPTRKGFTSSLAVLDHRYAHQHFPEFLWLNESLIRIPGNSGLPPSQRSHFADDLFTSYAIHFLTNAPTSKPFCLVISYLSPHRQLLVPPSADLYRDKPWPQPERAYAAMISRLDANIGRLLTALNADPARASNTLFIVTSDNGPHDADNHSPLFFNSSAGLRGFKFSLYEGGIRVPCLMHWPAHIPAGSICDTPCGFVDLAPTFCCLAGVSVPSHIHGVSLTPLFTSAPLPPRPVPLLWYTPPRTPLEPIAALRDSQWKFILRSDGTPELYDLSHDSCESRNLAQRHLTLVAAFYHTLTNQLRQPLPPLTLH